MSGSYKEHSNYILSRAQALQNENTRANLSIVTYDEYAGIEAGDHSALWFGQLVGNDYLFDPSGSYVPESWEERTVMTTLFGDEADLVKYLQNQIEKESDDVRLRVIGFHLGESQTSAAKRRLDNNLASGHSASGYSCADNSGELLRGIGVGMFKDFEIGIFPTFPDTIADSLKSGGGSEW